MADAQNTITWHAAPFRSGGQMNIDPYLPLWAGALWFAIASVIEWFRPRYTDAVEYDAALESAKLMKDWCTWMTGIATAAIAANGILISGATVGTRQDFATISVASFCACLLYTSPSPRDRTRSRMPSSA